MTRSAVSPAGRVSTADRALRAKVRAWIDDDPDPASQAELAELLARGDTDELHDRFRGGLDFGTAGLRGRLGAGPARINRATVRRTTAGLASYLLGSDAGAAPAGVVIGYDARHGSEALARETARVLTGAGLRALRLPRHLPTPVLAFAVRHLEAAAGVMVTASHLPAVHNGYKVYLADGAAIIPPADADIAASIDSVRRLADVPLGGAGDPIGGSIVDAYLDAILGALPRSAARDLRVVYTPLHGVGRDVLLAAFARAGFAAPHVVGAQADPDPDFPTVERPNPEEPGTLDLALGAAARMDADILLANDPDADRLAVAIPAASAPGAGARSPVTRSERCWVTTCSTAHVTPGTLCWSPPSPPRRCWRESRGLPAPGTPRP